MTVTLFDIIAASDCFFERLRKKNNESRSSKKRRVESVTSASIEASKLVVANGGSVAGAGGSGAGGAGGGGAASTSATTAPQFVLTAAEQARIDAEMEARDAIHRRNVQTLMLLVRHYGLHALQRGEHMLQAAAFFNDLLADYNDVMKRAMICVNCIYDDLTLLEELLCTVKLSAITNKYPFLLEPNEPKNSFTQVCGLF